MMEGNSEAIPVDSHLSSTDSIMTIQITKPKEEDQEGKERKGKWEKKGKTITWKGSWSSEPVMTMLGKSRRWTSRGSSIPFLDTMILLGCSSTGRDLTKAATYRIRNELDYRLHVYTDMPH